MPSKNLDGSAAIQLCFGDISRDEINDVLGADGLSRLPIKTSFAIGVKSRKKLIVAPKPLETVKTKEQTKTVEPQPKPTSPPPPPPPPPQTQQAKQVPLQVNQTSPQQTKQVSAPQPTLKQTKQGKQQQQQQQQQQQSKPVVEEKPKSIEEPAVETKPTTTATTTKATDLKPTSVTVAAATAAFAEQQLAKNQSKNVNGIESSATPTVPSPEKPKAASWASLVKSSEPQKPKVQRPSALPASSSPAPVNKVTKPSKPTGPSIPPVPKFTGLADVILKYEPTLSAPLLQPRGLINNVNTCFMNVILQPLLQCPPFYNLIKTISTHVVHSLQSKTPLVDSLIEFINEFQVEKPEWVDKNDPYGEPFIPEYVYEALRGQKKFDTLRGRQEDSEEFLCFLLDGLHEELKGVVADYQKKDEAANGTNGGGGWLEVGQHNKTNNLRLANQDESPITKIFGGCVRSILRCPGAKDSANLEPYQSLPLDIQPEHVYTVEDAIANMTMPETMHDYTNPKGLKVDATKTVYLDKLPTVLILHLKRFVFDNVGGVQKLSKSVHYGSKLVIKPEWLSPGHQNQGNTTYQLFGSVYHHGTSAGGGHYTCDIHRQNGEWLHIDDTTITPVSEKDVLETEENTRMSEKIHAGQTAYILFYIKA